MGISRRTPEPCCLSSSCKIPAKDLQIRRTICARTAPPRQAAPVLHAGHAPPQPVIVKAPPHAPPSVGLDYGGGYPTAWGQTVRGVAQFETVVKTPGLSSPCLME